MAMPPGSRSEACDEGTDALFRPSRALGLRALWLGSVSYAAAQGLQRDLIELRCEERIPDTILLLEHPHTYTVGAHGGPASFPSNRAELEAKGFSFHVVERGGDVTYHGPGQLVCYPVIDLKMRGLDLKGYVRDLEGVVIMTLRIFGIYGGRLPGYPGVWVEGEKIAAVGIKVNKRGITSHGFSLNVDCDLDYFRLIVPCGIKDKGVTSMHRILGVSPSMGEVRDSITEAFGQLFQATANLSIAAKSSSGLRGFDT